MVTFRLTSKAFLLASSCQLLMATSLLAGIHNAPIVLPAKTIRAAQYHPVGLYRVFRTTADGSAEAIPFQIDERDKYGDFILKDGPLPSSKYSNGIFDYKDELSFMGNDVGPVQVPSKWAMKKPSVLYEVTLTRGPHKGAIYIGAYFNDPPPLSTTSYVDFHLNDAEIITSRYRYRFDRGNYMVVRGIDINPKDGKTALPLIDSSTFYLRADLKYFLTLAINQSDIRSQLEAYTSGPIRTTARVNFNYKILKLNFDLGMYTEVSFFSNSVILPAIIDNPLEGSKSLNKGSLFYYGFALVDNPHNIEFATNMPNYEANTILDFLKGGKKVKEHYWITATHPNYMIFLEMNPSPQMQKAGNAPMFYKEMTTATDLKKRNGEANPLGKSPVNLAMALDLTSFNEGLHEVALRLFVENRNDPALLDEFKTLSQWQVDTRRLPSTSFK